MSKISHILLPNPVVVPTGTQLNEVAKLMKANNIASVLISKNGKLAGIISVEDIMGTAAEMARCDRKGGENRHYKSG